MAAAQAGITDNVPLHVLGGNIVPMALGKEFMLTRDVRNASLALVVAFPAENTTMAGGAPRNEPNNKTLIPLKPKGRGCRLWPVDVPVLAGCPRVPCKAVHSVCAC